MILDFLADILVGYKINRRLCAVMLFTFLLSLIQLLQFPDAARSGSKGTLLFFVPFIVPLFTLIVLCFAGRKVRKLQNLDHK
jgi:hypothetical protein